jgi:ATP-dependent DNA helicase RecQ
MAGDAQFRYRRELVRGTKKVERQRRIAVAVADEGVSEELLQRLKALRARLARQGQVPAYVVFSDRSLIDMARRVPLTRWDFGEVHGVGEAKLERFGEVFLAEVRRYVEEGAATRRVSVL